MCTAWQKGATLWCWLQSGREFSTWIFSACARPCAALCSLIRETYSTGRRCPEQVSCTRGWVVGAVRLYWLRPDGSESSDSTLAEIERMASCTTERRNQCLREPGGG